MFKVKNLNKQNLWKETTIRTILENEISLKNLQ